jgi:hypothetical protein
LVKAAIEVGRRDGAARLELATSIDNAAAEALYESLGWRRDSEFKHFKYFL